MKRLYYSYFISFVAISGWSKNLKSNSLRNLKLLLSCPKNGPAQTSSTEKELADLCQLVNFSKGNSHLKIATNIIVVI